MDRNVLLSINGDYVFVPLWLILSVSLTVLILLVVIFVVAKKSGEKKKDKKLLAEIEAEDEKNARLRKIMDAAPPITAFTEAEFPAGVDIYEYAHSGDGSLMDESIREEALLVWTEEQKLLKEKQIKARAEYFAAVDFDTVDTVDTHKAESPKTDGTEQCKEMSAKERKKYDKIRRDNEKRIARAKKLKEKEEKRGKKCSGRKK